LLAALGGAAVAWPFAARAQQGERMRRIGMLLPATADDAQYQAWVGAFVQLRVEVKSYQRARRRRHPASVTAFAQSSNGGLIVTGSPPTTIHRDVIIKLAAQHRLPAVYLERTFVAVGGLISYGPYQIDQFRQAAGYVDRILKGEKPADLPVQAPTKYELVLNMKTARALGSPCRRRCSPAPMR
jgi:ABC transporter substrate binding protein